MRNLSKRRIWAYDHGVPVILTCSTVMAGHKFGAVTPFISLTRLLQLEDCLNQTQKTRGFGQPSTLTWTVASIKELRLIGS
jgi:hypothetical protein